jgi:hypothetical protein
MLQFPRVTQDYLISTIVPGVFNGLLIYYSLRQTFYPSFSITTPYAWTFYLLFSILLTLLVGIIIEPRIYRLLTSIRNRGMFEKYDEFCTWRINICKRPENTYRVDHAYTIGCIEQIMYEYYCLNNIIPAIIISVLILGSYIFTTPAIIISVLTLGFYIPVLYKNVCMIQWVFFIADAVFLLCVCFVMRKWLEEYAKLRKLLLDTNTGNFYE